MTPTRPIARSVGGAGQLAITLKPHRGQMYQGIVPLEADSVSRAVETYFDTSEQLPTRIWADREPTHGRRADAAAHAGSAARATAADRTDRGNLASRSDAGRHRDRSGTADAARRSTAGHGSSTKKPSGCSSRSTSSSVARARGNAPRTRSESSAAPKSTTSSRRKVGSRSRASSAARTIATIRSTRGCCSNRSPRTSELAAITRGTCRTTALQPRSPARGGVWHNTRPRSPLHPHRTSNPIAMALDIDTTRRKNTYIELSRGGTRRARVAAR